MFHMKRLVSIVTVVLLLVGGAETAFAAPSASESSQPTTFAAQAVYTGKEADGKHRVHITWDDLGSNVSHYSVFRYPTLFPWGGETVCSNVTATSCENLSVERGQFRYIVTAYFNDGTELANNAGQTTVNIVYYTGAPASPSIFANHTSASSYSVGFSIASGNNADIWELYENGMLVNHFQGFLIENGQAPQTESKSFYNKPSGTYVYVVKLKNVYGTSESQPLTVVVP